MADDRMDALLARALETDEVPPEATAVERAELEGMLAAASQVRQARASAAHDANAAMPVARARFERFLQQQQAGAAAASRPAARAKRAGFFGGLGGVLAIAHGVRGIAVAAAVALVAVVALFAWQAAFQGTSTAAALEPGEYVELQGVVGSTSGEGGATLLALQSALGTYRISIDGETSVLEGETTVPGGSVRAGDAVLVGGVVGKDGRIVARTIARSNEQQAKPEVVTFKALKRIEGAMEARVVTFALRSDGRARLFVETPAGKRFVVLADRASAQRLLGIAATQGTRVQIGASAEGTTLASVQVAGATAAGATPASGASSGRPQLSLVRISGVVIAREPVGLRVATDHGPVIVRIGLGTRILAGESGLTLDAILRRTDTAIGHTVSVSGGLEPRTGVVIADVLSIGPKAPK